MNYEQLLTYLSDRDISYIEIIDDYIESDDDLEEEIIKIKRINSEIYSINSRIAIKINYISNVYATDEDVTIQDEDNVSIGLICFKENINSRIYNELTQWQRVAYYADLDIDNTDRKITFDYLVIDENQYSNYMENYYESAPLWGSFSHNSIVDKPYNKNIQTVTAVKSIKHGLTNTHRDNAIWAVYEMYSFERFLKLYHMIELLFYYEWVQQIKKLEDSTLFGINNTIAFYQKDEISQLKKVITLRIKEVEFVIPFLNKYDDYYDIATKIFFDYGKESNPIDKNKRDVLDKFNEVVRDKDFSFNNYKAKMKNGSSKYTEEEYKKDIFNLIVYFIYRIRCSIAHNKLGEYILTHQDEQFMVEFAEPLLRSVVIEAFKIQEDT